MNAKALRSLAKGITLIVVLIALLVFVAVPNLAHGAVLPQLTGISDGQVLTNPVTITLRASIADLDESSRRIEIYDGTKLIMGRYIGLSNYTLKFDWTDVPLGQHCVRAAIVDDNGSRQSPPICFTVVGGQIGFSDVLNQQTLPDVPKIDSPTTNIFTLRVRNQSGASSNPLRIRIYRSQTYFTLTNGSKAVPPTPPFIESFFTFAITNPALIPGGSFTSSVPLSANIICPPTETVDGDFAGRWQYHIFAALEELVGNKWTFIDRAKIFSSVVESWFPFNDGVVGADPGVDPLVDTNLFTFLTSLSILGNTNIQEGSVVAFAALASLNDGATGSVNAAWQSSPLNISSNGVFTAPFVQSDLNVDLNATFTRRTTRTAAKRITIANVGDPVTIAAPLSNQVAAIGDTVLWTVSAGGMPLPSYQWRKNGTNLVGATNPTLSLANVQLASAGAYHVIVSNLLGAVSSSTGNLAVVTRPSLTTPFRDAGGAFRFGVQGTPGSPCRIESSTNLPQWNFLTNVTLGASPALLTNALIGPRRFFRVRIDASP